MQTKKQTTSFAIGAPLIAFVLFAYYAYTWRNFTNFRIAIDTCADPLCDFASFYYPMGEAIFQTEIPIEGFVYSPFTAILLSVFPLFGFDTALILWGCLQALAILLYVLLFRRLIPTGQRILLLFFFLALSSFPLLHAIKWGQVGIITTVSVLGALFFYERGHRATAAILLAFGVSFKFFPLIFLLPFLIRRDFRFLILTALACGLFLFVVPFIALGMDGMMGFYSALLDSYRHFDWVIANYNSQHFPHVLLRLIYKMGFDVRAYLPLLRWIGYGVAAINIGLLYLVQRAQVQRANLWGFHILFLTIPFVLLTSWPADLVYLSFAQGLLAWQLLEEKKGIRASRNAPLVLLIASIVISSIFSFNILGNSTIFGSIGFIFWSNLLLLVATYVELLPIALRQINSMSIGNLLSRVMERKVSHDTH